MICSHMKKNSFGYPNRKSFLLEERSLSRKGNVRLVSYTAAVLIVLVAAVAACHVGAGEYTTRIDAHSARAFGEAHSAAERLQRSLDACAYATDAQMQSALCTQLYADAAAAETAHCGGAYPDCRDG